MPLELHDAVVLKNDPTVKGTVERTPVSDGGESVEDLLILNYTEVTEAVLNDFVRSGTPPSGHVFVVCVQEEKGAFIAHEDDLVLLCRSFDLGDLVKQHGQTSSMLGVVVNLEDTYDLRPVLYQRDGVLESVSKPDFKEEDAATIFQKKEPCDCGHKPEIIRNVPAGDIFQAVPLFEGNLAQRDDWVGLIDGAEYDIVILRRDKSIAVLKSPLDLHIPIQEPKEPLVMWPEYDSFSRPSILSAFQGWSTIPAPRIPRLGTFVTTTKETLKEARWIRGQYKEESSLGEGVREGIIIAVIPNYVDVRWISANPFTRRPAIDVMPPSRRQTVFKNINSFTTQTDLARKRKLRLLENSVLEGSNSSSGLALPGKRTVEKPVGSLLDLYTGDQAHFRDPAAAMSKYTGQPKCACGAFRPVDHDLDGWALNFLDVVSQNQHVTVQWQDGQQTTHHANDLFSFNAFEVPLVPGNLVLDKSGLKMSRTGRAIGTVGNTMPVGTLDFNEMAFFERPHELVPSRVGVVQAIDTKERVATVRWFHNPKIVLIDGGEVLHPKSMFGSISDETQEVSLYEVMTFPAFDWRLGDSIMLPPGKTMERLRKALKNKGAVHTYDMPLAVNPTLDFERLLVRAEACMDNQQPIQRVLDGLGEDADDMWLGDIVSIDLDGTITVRLLGSKGYMDVQVPLDAVLATIKSEEVDDLDYDGGEEEEEEFWEDYLDDSRSLTPISEHIEYEGGERMDEDEDDDAWVSAEEDMASSASEAGIDAAMKTFELPSNSTGGTDSISRQVEDGDVEMADVSTQTHSPAAVPPTIFQNLPQIQEAPPSFDVLSIEPPADQFSRTFEPNTSAAFLKRIAKEHRALFNSLPTGQIYVRTYESRLDLLRCLIIGPPDTPYEDAPFLIDLHLGRNFPEEPPVAHFHSWTSGLGRINPNLYEEGKICLSLLGTWPGKESKEGWSKDATILQVLVSLQGLVMVRNPFFNEAGYDGYEAEGLYKTEAAQYAEKAFVMSRGFVKHALTRPPDGLADVLGWLYAKRVKNLQNTGLLKRILDRGRSLIQKSEEARVKVAAESSANESQDVELMDAAGNTGDPTKAFLRPLSKGAVVMLRRLLGELEAAAATEAS